MSGRHRRPRTTPGRLALFGTVPLVGGAGLAAALAGADGTDPARNVTPTPTAAVTNGANGANGGATDAAEPVAVPGRGEIVLDAVGGARDAATRAADAQTSARVSTVAAELRDQARARAEAARAAGAAELAAYHRDEAARQDRLADSSRPVLLDDHTADGVGSSPLCRAADVVRLGQLTAAGPECDDDPWIAGQIDDAMRRGGVDRSVG
ncbi:hypothetical protein [Pseudonocardia sp. ICBG1142]|uniref:hypothetical protein n=1 Tax=Pseudonocardia sp. ICBG1142 TaxID=2846760 RepID=UPI001CF714F3|nr:hypothetical protein [Pseudonocardia sp. ICBG1142]